MYNKIYQYSFGRHFLYNIIAGWKSKFGTLKNNTNELNPIYKRWDEVTRKMVWDDKDEKKMGPVVPDEEMVLVQKAPHAFEGSTRTHRSISHKIHYVFNFADFFS